MRNHNVSSQIRRLNDLFEKVAAASGEQLEMRSHWAKYLCVLSAGFLENAISEIYGEYTRRSANPYVADYANSILSGIQNPNAQKFIETANRFRKAWAIDLEAYLSLEGRREAINSIMGNRHQIVHGKSSGITLVQIRDYLDKAVEVVEFIETQCDL